jgi:hypothetical protein
MHHGLELFFGLLGIVFIAFGSIELARQYELEAEGIEVFANIYEQQSLQSRKCRVRYRFGLRNTDTFYTRSDFLGRTDIWSEMPRFDCGEIRNQKAPTLRIRYLPRDPWVNQPVSEFPSNLFDIYAALVTGVVGLCLAAYFYWILPSSGGDESTGSTT